MAEETPLGPRKFDFGTMPDEDFEEMCHELVRLEWPDVSKTATPDGGADTLLPRKKTQGWKRAWQAKRYTGTIFWSKCKDSLDRAIDTYEIERVTFCFAKNLTKNQQKKFDSDLRGRHTDVEVDFWDKAALVDRLNRSKEGRRVARHYFGDPAHDKELMVRAIRAGGDLESGGDAVERAKPVGEFLGGHDGFFFYSQVIHEEGSPAPPPAEGTVLSVTNSEGGISIRHDAIPRHPDAMARFGPRITVGFTDDEVGRRAAAALAEATSRGRPVVLDDGVEITPERLPPLWQDEVGRTLKATVKVRPNVPPWRAEITAKSAEEEETVVVPLELEDESPEDWDQSFRGQFGGMTFSILIRRREERGEMSLNWTHRLGTDPASEQVAALRLLIAMHRSGEVIVRDLEGGRPELRHPTVDRQLPDKIPALLGFLEDLVAIENWLGRSIPIPDREIGADEAHRVAMAAEFIRRRSIPARWNKAKVEVGPDGLEKVLEGGQMLIEHAIGMRLLGEEVPFALGRIAVPSVEVRDLGPTEEGSDVHSVEIVPPDGEPVSVDWEIRPPD